MKMRKLLRKKGRKRASLSVCKKNEKKKRREAFANKMFGTMLLSSKCTALDSDYANDDKVLRLC